MNDMREIAEKIVARGASINPLYVCGEIVSVPELAAAYLDLLKRTESHVLRSPEPLGATYEEVRKARCAWCAKGLPIVSGIHKVAVEKPPDWMWEDPPHDRVPCTAPTPEQVIEEQGREIARLRKPAEPLGDARLREIRERAGNLRHGIWPDIEAVNAELDRIMELAQWQQS